jgi:predicted N-formylglutamate amidohydrolase
METIGMQQELADSAGGSTRPYGAAVADPAIVLNPGALCPLLLVGDHAGRDIPPHLHRLDLPAGALGAHIAWDIGVAGLGAELSAGLGATFIAQRYSRLVIDCNRDPARADSIVEISDGVPIPGNAALTAEARAERTARIFRPYHDRIAAEIEARLAAGRPTILVCLHSFTAALSGAAPRPWHVGVLHLGDSEASRRMLELLRGAFPVNLVGDNEPYQMDGTDFTAPHHAIARGLGYLELEIRQDLIADPAGQAAMARLLGPLLGRLADP